MCDDLRRPSQHFVTRQIVSSDGQIGPTSRVAAHPSSAKDRMRSTSSASFAAAFVGTILACPSPGAPGWSGDAQLPSGRARAAETWLLVTSNALAVVGGVPHASRGPER